MKKVLILYVSVHHGNTRQVVEHLAEQEGVTAVDLLGKPLPDLTGYELIGFASGVYFQKLHQRLRKAVGEAAFGPGQQVFFLYTCGVPFGDCAKDLKGVLAEKGVPWAGTFRCRGYDTYGPWGKLGGIAKGRPNGRDLDRAAAFLRGLREDG